MEQLQIQNQQLSNDKKQLQQTVHQLEQLVSSLEQKTQEQEADLVRREAENSKLLAQLFNKAEISKQRDQFEEMYYEEQSQRSQLSDKIDDLKRELTSLREKDHLFTESLRADLASI